MERINTKRIAIGNKFIGGCNKILIQSMCNIPTSNFNEVINQINECEKLGADMMRISIINENEARLIPLIKKEINIPLICDIQYDLKLAILSIQNGADAIRINPANTSLNEIELLIDECKKRNATIRIGFNDGSIKNEKDIFEYIDNTIKFFESKNFSNIVISYKSSDIKKTIDIYEKLSEITSYPLHIGLTESGFDEYGIIKSVSCLSPLLLKGIGDTIRISLTGDPKKEILACKRLLHSLDLYDDYPTFISCPTCGRTTVKNIEELCTKTLAFLEENKINLKVAIMGCAVNGINEAKNADIGLSANYGNYIMFKKGQVVKTIEPDNALEELFKEIILENHRIH